MKMKIIYFLPTITLILVLLTYVGIFAADVKLAPQLEFEKSIDESPKHVEFEKSSCYVEFKQRTTIIDGDKVNELYSESNLVRPAVFRFDDARDFSEGLAAVMLSPKREPTPKLIGWGFIDKSGKYVIEPQFHTLGKCTGL